MDLNIQGKTALITGSHRGTGFVIAESLAAEGVEVVIHGFEAEASAAAAAQIPGALSVWGDITSDQGAEQVVEQLQTLGKTPDILINNYGEAAPGKYSTSTSADWLESYQKNTLSVVRMVQAFSPAMASKGWGRIINLGTIGSNRPNKIMPQYYAAKGALANLTVSLAKDLGGTGINVNLVSPGMIRTPEVEASFMKKAQKEGWGDSWEEAEASIVKHLAPNPLGRIASREEVANVVVFLASEAASFVHGQNWRVDGQAVDMVS